MDILSREDLSLRSRFCLYFIESVCDCKAGAGDLFLPDLKRPVFLSRRRYQNFHFGVVLIE